MLIAAKYEEIYAPEVRDFVYVTDKSYTKEDILSMEYQILSTLNFDILHVSPYHLLQRYHFITNENILCFYLAQFILEFTMLEYKMLVYTPSIKAASCIFIARKLLKLENVWPSTLQVMTGYQESHLSNCCRDLCKIMELVNKITLKSCITKFSSIKYYEVAKSDLFKKS